MTENFPDEGMKWANPSKTKIKYWRKIHTAEGVKKFYVYGSSVAEIWRKLQESLQEQFFIFDEKKYSFDDDSSKKKKQCKDCPFMYCYGCMHNDIIKNNEFDNTPLNRKKRTNNTSGRTGVRWNKNQNKWLVSIGYKGRVYFCGYHDSFEVAVKAREFLERNIKGLV